MKVVYIIHLADVNDISALTDGNFWFFDQRDEWEFNRETNNQLVNIMIAIHLCDRS